MGRRWSSETKAKAAADLASGMTVKAVAEKYGMPRSTAGDLAPSSKRGGTNIRKIADLQDVKELFQRHLALNFAAQEAILGKFTDAEWLDRQTAVDLSGSHTALFTKSGKLLGALYGPAAAAVGSDDADDQDTA
jgi:hypothetical protein